MPFIHNTYLSIILSSVAVYLFIIIAIRIFGKKELSQLSVIDLVFILLISNAVQNAMVGDNTTLAGGLTAAVALFLTNYLLKQALFYFPHLGRLVQGEAIVLIYKGHLYKKNMSRARITMDELMEAIREHGISAGIPGIDLAVLEVDGNISVLSENFMKKSIRKRKSHKILTKVT